jgi:hypothetical protein
MKKVAIFLVLTVVFFMNNSCSKSEADDLVDCFAESIYIKLHHSTDASNPKLVNYSIEYTGSNTLSSVKWTFGDGSTGTGAVVTHTYSTAGTYEVKADVTVKKGGSDCTSSPKRSITIN